MRTRSRAVPAAGLAVAVLLGFGCGGPMRLELSANDPNGYHLAQVVDSEPARRLLVDLLARRSPDPRLAALAPSFLGAELVSDLSGGPGASRGRLPDQTALRELGRQVSVDFAALAFAYALGADERSRTAQAEFDRVVRDGQAGAADTLRRPGTFPYTVLFAPGWLYRSHPGTGADFAYQRRLLDRLGIDNRLIATPESDSVEDNASVIASAVREAGGEGRALILVSISKSGAEVALALSRRLDPEEVRAVAAWVNVAGAFRGTPIVDAGLRPPVWWLARLLLRLLGGTQAGLNSLATGPSVERLDGARLPDSIAVVNLMAVPVSGSVGPKLYGSYRVLLDHGPNDGLLLLADAVWPGGINIVALGSDHLFEVFREDAHSLALLHAVDLAVRLHGGR